MKTSESLNLPSSGEVAEWIGRAVPRIIEQLEPKRPIDCILVQGDTMSAYAGALAASKLRIPLGHIEAGLRSGDIEEPWPEERIRRAISVRAQYHFAPTERSKRNLLSENVPEDRIKVTGNSIVSALHLYTDPEPVEVPLNQILVTMHRREWTDGGRALVLETINAFLETAEDYPDIQFLWPMHPGVAKVAEIDLSNTPQNVSICPPMPYQATIDLLKHSLGIATDSGGLSEEAAILGVPCAILRNLTDRPESIEAGVARLFPPTPEGMKDALKTLVGRTLPRKPTEVFGTKDSATRIATGLLDFLAR